jgi:hypothetical protein
MAGSGIELCDTEPVAFRHQLERGIRGMRFAQFLQNHLGGPAFVGRE